MPCAALLRMLSFACAAAVSGMETQNVSTQKATAKLARSMAITVSIPHSPMTAVVRIGVRIELSELERYRRPPTF